jgi:hypothetical protein
MCSLVRSTTLRSTWVPNESIWPGDGGGERAERKPTGDTRAHASDAVNESGEAGLIGFTVRGHGRMRGHERA